MKRSNLSLFKWTYQNVNKKVKVDPKEILQKADLSGTTDRDLAEQQDA